MRIKISNILSVVIGLISIFIIGLLLFPVLEMVLKRNMEFQIKNPGSFSFDSILVESIWLGMATFFGGYITSSIAMTKTIFHSLITGALAFIIILGIGIFANNRFSIITLIGATSSFLFCLMGGLMQKYIYIQKHENE